MDTDKFFTILFAVLCLCFNAHSQRFDEKRLNDSLAKYDYFEGVVNDLIKVQKNSKCGFVNIKGEEIIPLRYSWDKSYCYENFCAMQTDDSIVLFSKMGEVIPSDKIKDINEESRIIYFQNKVGIVVDDKIKYLDANMYWVADIGFYFIFQCDDEGNQYSLLYDYEGNEILKYDEIHFMLNRSLFSHHEFLQRYSNQYFIVKKNNKYGVVDLKERLIVPFKFDKNIITLSDNYLIYHNFNKSELSFIVFSLSGDALSSTEYDRCSTYKNYIFGWHDSDCDIICNNKLTDRFKFGKNLITKDSSHVTINTLSNESVLDYFYINGDLLIYETNGKCGVIHKNGKEIVPCNYFDIDVLDNLIIAHKDSSYEPIVSLFDKKGNCIKDNLCYAFTSNIHLKCLFTSSTDKDNESYKNLHPMLRMGLGEPPKTYYIWNDKKAKLIEVKHVVGDKLSIDYCKVKSDDGTYRIIKVK